VADRRYDDKEVGEILKAAAEMQSGLAKSGSADGLTLDELQRVAAEIGINPAHIGRAANELDSLPKGKSSNKSDSILLEKSINGELSDEAWEELETELRRFTGSVGQTESSNGSREWTGNWDTGSITLSATNRRGRTRLRLLGNTSGYSALAVTIGIVCGILLPLVPIIVANKNPQSFTPIVTALLTAWVAGLCVAGTVGTIRTHRKSFGKRTEALLANLTGIAESFSVTPQSVQTDSFAESSIEKDLSVRVNQR